MFAEVLPADPRGECSGPDDMDVLEGCANISTVNHSRRTNRQHRSSSADVEPHGIGALPVDRWRVIG
jgi:hypothetical protein